MKYEMEWQDGEMFALSKFICECGHDFVEESDWDNITHYVEEKIICPECGNTYRLYWNVKIIKNGDKNVRR